MARLRNYGDVLQTRAGWMPDSPRPERLATAPCVQIDLTGHSRSPRRCGAGGASRALGDLPCRSRSPSRSIPRRRGQASNKSSCYYAGYVNIPECKQKACFSVWAARAKPKGRIVCGVCKDWMEQSQLLDNERTEIFSGCEY